MDEELRKAAQNAIDNWDARLQGGVWAVIEEMETVIEEMENLRAALAKNASAAQYSDLVSDGGLDPRNASAVADEIIKLYGEGNPDLQTIEQYRLQMAGISVAAIGYWKEGDEIHPDYDTPALRDVAKLYVKYDELYKTRNTAPQDATDWEAVSADQAMTIAMLKVDYQQLQALVTSQGIRLMEQEDWQKDAERYRFMRGNESIKFWSRLGELKPIEWDEFIDAAMEQKP